MDSHITIEFGDILDWAGKADVIGHQVNCFGVMGGGLALQIARKWPNVLTAYQSLIKEFTVTKPREELLGNCQIVPVKGCAVANLFGQFDMGWGCQTSYNALARALASLRDQMAAAHQGTVALPVKLGCGLAGGDWDTVLAVIRKTFEGSGLRVILVEFTQ
jgi:O-acetyl-ADP-ribose deacetylase (regulator of RNase III)